MGDPFEGKKVGEGEGCGEGSDKIVRICINLYCGIVLAIFCMNSFDLRTLSMLSIH